jgi:hypothetical protein
MKTLTNGTSAPYVCIFPDDFGWAVRVDGVVRGRFRLKEHALLAVRSLLEEWRMRSVFV